MTPGCTVCGYAVEWLRSCYAGNWRLFQGSNATTRGYYYFSPVGTPHYPGLHNLGSRIWRNDDFQNPPLGEAEGPQAYRKGALAIPPPPAVLIGSAACIQSGDTLPLPLISRTLPAGVDSRCYPGQALIPDPPPALNLGPSGLAADTPGKPFMTWPDGSIYGNDAVASDIMSAPTAATVVGALAGDYTPANTQYLTTNIEISGDFAVFALAYIPSQGLPGKVATLASGLIQVGATSITSNCLPVGSVATTANNLDAIHLFSVVRIGTTVTIAVDGVTVGTFSPALSAPISVTQLATTTAGDVLLLAFQVFDQTLSASGINKVTQSLKGSIVGLTTYQCSSLVARNTTQAAGAPIAADTVNVTCTATDYAVVLPAGCYRIIVQGDPTNPRTVLVFPPVGAALGPNMANTPVPVNPASRVAFSEISGTQWAVESLS